MKNIYVLILFAYLCSSMGLKAQNESTQGRWSDPIPFGIVPVAVANLPDGNLICWSSQFRDTFIVEGDGMTFTELFDPFSGVDGQALGEFVSNTDHDMFCPGINNLADGRILSAGGTSSEKTSIYDWRTNTWSVADQMNIPRGYQGNVTLSDGTVFTIGGSWSGGNYTNRDAEIYSSLTGWLRLPNISGEDISVSADFEFENQGDYRIDNHAWLWVAPSGDIFHAGPSEMMHWIDVDVPGGAITEAGIRQDTNQNVRDYYSMKGNTVMFDTGKILKTGGARAYGDDEIITVPATDNSFVIDLNGLTYGDTPNVTAIPKMSFARTMHNSTVLPNGEVLVTGGLGGAAVFTDDTAVYGAELFNESTGWTTVAAMTVPRTYHSVAILMVDGRVFVGGGGLCDSTPGCVDHFDAEIYSPPYLFNPDNTLATRPVINSGPETADYNTTIAVSATTGIQEFSLIRFSAATHATNNEQRRIPVTFTPSGSNYSIDIPQRELLPPGYYMLFGLDANGTPSIAHTIQIGNEIPLSNNSNLVLDMRFDETSGTNVSDSSQYNHDGTIVQRDNNGNPETPNQFSWEPGLIDNALEFDGLEFNSNSLVEIDYSAELASTANSITVSAWAYRDSNSGIPEAGGKIANVGILSQSYPRMFFGFHNTLYKWAFVADSPLDCYSGYAPLDTWVHLAATYDGAVAKLYANGVEVCSRAMSGSIDYRNDASELSSFTASGFFEDGSRALPAEPYGNSSGITDEISGKMDQLKVYNKVLGPAEIQALYQEGLDTNNPDLVVCPTYLTVEYRIGLSGTWIPIDSNDNFISAPLGSQVFIRPTTDYTGEYYLTTPQYDGPTYSNVTDSGRFTADNAYQLDTHVFSGFVNFPPWDDPDRGNGMVDLSNEGQFVISTPNGCPTTINFSILSDNTNGDCPNYLPNDDPTIFIVSGSLTQGLDEAHGTATETNGSECALQIINQDTNQGFSHFKTSITIANYGIQIGDEIYIELDGKGNNSPRLEVYKNDDPPSGSPVLQNSFGSNWSTFAGSFIISAGTETIDLWLYSNYNSASPGEAFYDNLKIINLTATGGNLPPTADFTATPITGDAPLLVNFDASLSSDDDGIDQYVWTLGDGTISSLQNPSNTYTTPGTYMVTLAVFDTGGLRDEKTTTIVVNDPSNEAPVAVASANPISGTVPLTVDFTGSTSTDDVAVTSYQWDFGNGNTDNVADPQHIFNAVGTYTVSLTVFDAEGENDTTTLTITVNEVPNEAPVAVASANPISGTVPLTVDFTGSTSTDDVAVTSYQWDFRDGSFSSEPNPTKTFTQPGIYKVILEVNDLEGLKDSTIVVITVNDIDNEVPVAIAQANPTSGTAPLAVQFDGTNSTDEKGITSYLWDFDNGTTSDEINPVFTFTHARTYTVSLLVRDEEGLENIDFVEITVSETENSAPIAVVSATPTQGEAPLNVDFTGSDSTDDKEIVSYNWDFGNGASSSEINPSTLYNEPGTYTGSLTVQDEEGLMHTASITIVVSQGTIDLPPVASISSSVSEGLVPLTVQFDGSNSTDDNNIVSYNWDFGDGQTATIVNPEHIFELTGSFDVTLIVTDDEGQNAETSMTIMVLKSNSETIASVILAPNPANGIIHIYLASNVTTSPAMITLFDYAGSFLSSYVPAEIFNENHYQVPAYGLSDGQYFIRIELENNEPLGIPVLIKNE